MRNTPTHSLATLLLLFVACGPDEWVEPNPGHKKVGLPDCSFGTLLTKTFYITCHDDYWLIPEWVGYVLDPDDLLGTVERTDDFRADPALPEGFRAELRDYRGSGYDRGHMAPAGDFTRSYAAMSETFFLSNIAPQDPDMNRGIWAALESAIRDRVRWASRAWIYTGNIVEDSLTIGANEVAVPTECFKVLVVEETNRDLVAFGFLIPNEYHELDNWWDFQVAVDDVEWATGIDFFYELPDAVEDHIEWEMPWL